MFLNCYILINLKTFLSCDIIWNVKIKSSMLILEDASKTTYCHSYPTPKLRITSFKMPVMKSKQNAKGCLQKLQYLIHLVKNRMIYLFSSLFTVYVEWYIILLLCCKYISLCLAYHALSNLTNFYLQVCDFKHLNQLIKLFHHAPLPYLST